MEFYHNDEFWVQIIPNLQYSNDPRRIEGSKIGDLSCLYFLEWILCQDDSTTPCLMEKNAAIYQECRNADHPIYIEPYTTSTISGYVIPRENIVVLETICIAKKTFGKLANQSLGVCQADSLVGYVCLSEDGIDNFIKIL